MDNSGTITARESTHSEQSHQSLAPAEIGGGGATQPRRTGVQRRHHGSNEHWPALEQLGLSASERAARLEGLGGSDANIIFSGDPQKILDLWKEKRGEKSADDLSSVMPVVLGMWTEPFNRQWYEKLTGACVSRMGARYTSTDHPWRQCTLDGFVEVNGAVFEAKHTNGFAKPEEVLGRYMPQLQHNMAITKSERAVLSVIFGNHKFEYFDVAADWLYQLELLDAEASFWDCVVGGREPVAVEPPSPPKPIGTREVCLEGNNAWAVAAVDWLEHRDAAKTHAAACGAIKSMVQEDVTRAFGHGIEAKRSRAGAISIKELA